jgi:leucyl-tRNA synthetase
MGVPGHDQRDYDFAKKHDLPIVYVITNQINDAAYEGDGIHINSPLINNLDIAQSKKVMLAYLTKHKIGVEHITYKLKD